MMSMHSARTPIQNYLGGESGTNTPAENAPAVSDGYYSKSGVDCDQLIMRRLKEKKQRQRMKQQAKSTYHLPTTEIMESQKSGRREVEREADQLVRPISKYLKQ